MNNEKNFVCEVHEQIIQLHRRRYKLNNNSEAKRAKRPHTRGSAWRALQQIPALAGNSALEAEFWSFNSIWFQAVWRAEPKKYKGPNVICHFQSSDATTSATDRLSLLHYSELVFV